MLKKYSVTNFQYLFLQPFFSRHKKFSGELSEWLKEHAWKVCIRETVSRVRIPHSPQLRKLSTEAFSKNEKASVFLQFTANNSPLLYFLLPFVKKIEFIVFFLKLIVILRLIWERLNHINLASTKITLAKYAKALAHPARVAILQLLVTKATCQCGDIVDELPLSQSTVSQHLKELKNAGLIKGRNRRR